MNTNDPIRDFKSGTDYTAGKAKAGVDETASTLKDAANKYGPKVEEYATQTYNNAKDVAQRNLGDFEQQIRDKPVQSALIAVGVGFLVGALITR